MPRAYAKKSDAYRARLTVPMTEQSLDRIRRYAAGRGQAVTCAARDLIERGFTRTEDIAQGIQRAAE